MLIERKQFNLWVMTGTPYRSDLLFMFISSTLCLFLFVHPHIHPRKVPRTTFWSWFYLISSQLLKMSSLWPSLESFRFQLKLQKKTKKNEGVQPETYSTCIDICSETEHRRFEQCHDTWLYYLDDVWERSHFSGSGLRWMWPAEEWWLTRTELELFVIIVSG